MSALAIICEYNPFHNGHAYHLDAAIKSCRADTVYGIMSGCFVQRAEPSVVLPQTRAAAAIMHGMDCVIEMPTIFSCAAGNVFANGAVSILSRISDVKYLAMGVEDDGNILRKLADIQYEQSERYGDILKSRLSDGLAYAVAVTEATVECADLKTDKSHLTEILKKPNNILATEYLKALRKYRPDIEPIFIERKGNGYNDVSHTGEYISATAARQLLYENKFDELRPHIPSDTFDSLKDEFASHRVNSEVYDALTVNALRTQNIADAFDSCEGLDKKIAENAARYSSLEKILQESKSKRYTMSRLKRIAAQTLLGITKSVYNSARHARGRVIAIKNTRKDILKNLTDVAVKNTDYSDFGTDCASVAAIDGRAGSIYSLVTRRDGNAFWDRKLLIV